MKFKFYTFLLVFIISTNLSASSNNYKKNNLEGNPPIYDGFELIAIAAYSLATLYLLNVDEIGFDTNYFLATPQNNHILPNISLRNNARIGAFETNYTFYKSDFSVSTKMNFQLALIFHGYGFIKNKNVKLETGIGINSNFGMSGITGLRYKHNKYWSFSLRVNYFNSKHFKNYPSNLKIAPHLQGGFKIAFGGGNSLIQLMKRRHKKINGKI